MEHAFRLWQDGVSAYKAAMLAGVPTQTLLDRTKAAVYVPIRPGPQRTFSAAEELALVKHLELVRECGFSCRRKQLLDVVNEAALFLGKRREGQPLSRKFYYGFLERWPQFREDNLQSPSKARAQQTSEETRQAYYRRLKDVLEEHELLEQPQLIFTAQETMISSDPSLLQESALVDATFPEAISATLVTCVSAVGQTLPPFIVFKGKQLSDDMIDDMLADALPGTQAVTSVTGTVTSSVLQDFLVSHFVRHHPSPGEGIVLLLFEGSRCRVTAPLVQWARDRNIVFFPLPPHLAHPPTLGCFGQFRKAWGPAVRDLVAQKAGADLPQHDLRCLICKAYADAFSVGTVTSFFKAAGIFPVNPTSSASGAEGAPSTVTVGPNLKRL